MPRTLSELWRDEFVSDNGHCGICGNHGIINTVGKVRTPAGVECGIRAYCVCPNGRAMRRGALRRMKVTPPEKN